ncbi:MAG TPA: PAS domain S-box protein [Polyangiaceae bacterium]|nr:PAS domain S-box protein [Polyangiaceae bacterium]
MQQGDSLLLSLLPPELLDQFACGIFVTDALGEVVAANRAAADMLGYAQEELVGKNIAAFTHPEDVSRRALAGALTVGQTLAARRRLLHKDGRYRVTDGQARVLEDGRIVSVVNDVTALVTAEQALHESAEQMRFAANAVPALIAYVDAQARYVWTNETYRRWFGHAPDAIRGLHASEVLGASAWASIQPFVERALGGEAITFEHRLVYKSGPARDVRASYVPHLDEAGRVRGFVGLVNDITEIRTAEAALRRSEHMLEHSQSISHVGSWEVTLEGCHSDPPGCLRWSDETYRIFGYEPGAVEVSQGLFFGAIHPDDRAATRAASRGGMERGEPFEKDYRIIRPDGTVRAIHAWSRFECDAGGKPVRMLGTCQDITERTGLERALRLSEERYRSLLGAITSVVWTADAEGNFVEPQPAWEAYTGQAWKEHRARGWTAAVHADDRARIERYLSRASHTGAPFRAACRVWHAPSAGHRFCETSAVAIRNADGAVREWIGTLVDEHERERALQELRDTDRRKDEFLAMLSHELRNPLAPILSAVEVLDRTDPGDGERISKYRAIIARQVQHMKRLLDDLLDVSRVSQGKIQLRKEPLELGALLLQAVEVSRPMIVEKQQELSMTLAARPLPLDADPTRLVQVFANLLNNAAKYTDGGGHIALTVAVENGDAVVRVRDDGMGMSPELLGCAFELFVQETRSLDRAQGGLGIGLTMVRTLVKMHGGTVRAFSEGPGRGSEFVVRLPLATREPAPRDVPVTTPTPREAQGQPLRVLVVDDNVDAAGAIGDLLEILGHQVTLAHDGPGALAAAAAGSPELVLLDIGLPGMDGYAVAAGLRGAGHERATLVAITGYGQDEHLRRSSEAGFDHHLVKPLDFDMLGEIAAQVRGRAAAERRGKP